MKTSKSGFLLTMLPEWFRDGLPSNPLVGADQPWLDTAPPNNVADHPSDPVIFTPDQAAFRYNPYHGIFRAPVIPQFTKQHTLDLYNRLNGTGPRALPDPDR